MTTQLDKSGRYPEPIGPESPADRQAMGEWAKHMLATMDLEDADTAAADVIAAIGFLFPEYFPAGLREELADPPKGLVQRVKRLAVIRWRAVEAEESGWEEEP